MTAHGGIVTGYFDTDSNEHATISVDAFVDEFEQVSREFAADQGAEGLVGGALGDLRERERRAIVEREKFPPSAPAWSYCEGMRAGFAHACDLLDTALADERERS